MNLPEVPAYDQKQAVGTRILSSSQRRQRGVHAEVGRVSLQSWSELGCCAPTPLP
ncbi:hypothetical protein AURDEDRAFT_178139 [Auricularia subglabra TFB-10046 SS5]|uniref:Uncharacterized protein n=1 Tax=Auricularia subglabra (strain TFB-10046 / SS5) TaxID=717982 RepID=J0CR75_AURST|nr:hypothetical protein AURDEDRAFT_178139 [Auricularia subglabra TFB-10046 SS5]